MFWAHAMAASRHLFIAKAASVFLKVTRKLGEALAPSTVAQWPPELRVLYLAGQLEAGLQEIDLVTKLKITC